MASNEKFVPAWYEEPVPAGTWRSIFKWGDPAGFKHPNSGLTKLIMDRFGLSKETLSKPGKLGLDLVPDDVPSALPVEHHEFLVKTCGEEHLRTDTYTRIKRSYGQGMIDALRLRRKIVENLPDVVVAPRSQEEIEAIVAYANENLIPIYVFGGGSTVTRGYEATKGGICIDMSVHMNKLVELNEIDHTVTVEAGMWGTQLEDLLQNAVTKLGAKRNYTVGHFPQSFEYSSVGGWVVTRGAGQNSTYYGKLEDMVIDQEYVTPRGIFKTCPHPRAATGPDFDQVMIGGEGSFGILSKATLKIWHHQPENRKKFSYMFHNWKDAQAASREIMQGEFGFPSVYRISDPEETDIMMHLYHISDSIANTLLTKMGFKPMQKCLLLGFTDGEKDFCRNMDRKIRRICRKYKAFELSIAGVTKTWEKGRFTDPYLREDLQDYGILIDTLECGVTWSQMPRVHEDVRAYIKSRPNTICMTHISHSYPQGANLYFIFIAKIDTIREYLDLQYGILEAIAKSGAAISHHHGVGKATAPWLEDQIGSEQMEVIRLLKKHFDPNNIMNPGGTLGLDMTPAQKEKRWGKDFEV
ncbi:MAG: FAD-binding oxidoreductase [Chloroflexi bacterium]|nr:FAD-binding oxidoreductase [Chloroflexota bacterium]